jgi:dinuclear metal center YbgI/SA1388 family protein
MKLAQVVRVLGEIAPLRLAAEWDNVGLLLEPVAGAEVRRVLLTIDLTAAVAAEALQHDCDLVVAYHPPIFGGLSRLTQASARERSLLQLVQAGVAIYSPHTALDAVHGGVNDWIADGLGKASRSALEPAPPAPGESGYGEAGPGKSEGQGRLLQFARPQRLSLVLTRIKKHLGQSRLRVAAPARHEAVTIRSVALCAGAGGSVVNRAAADLLLTGEMRHHDILAAVERGSSVVLTEHSNSERGYLPRFARRLQGQLDRGVKVRVSTRDCEPIGIF